MDVSVGPHWESFVEALVSEGRFASAGDVLREGLRLVEEREEKHKALRETIQASIAEGGSFTADEVMQSVRGDLDAWRRKRA